MRILFAGDNSKHFNVLVTSAGEEHVAEIVGCVFSPHALIDVAKATHPHLVFIYLNGAQFAWIRAAEQIQGLLPKPNVACLSSSPDASFFKKLTSAGVVTRSIPSCTDHEDLAFLRELVRRPGGPDVSPIGGLRKNLDALTPRECQILIRVAHGCMSHEIAQEFHLSPRTVEFHRANILRKTGTRTGAEATRYALLHGILDGKA